MIEEPADSGRTVVSVENGKYTFISEPGDYRIKALRHGEEWLTFEQGSKALLAMMYELETARVKP